ncbi:TetR/AcrR family transcriptional regulator [Massilia sp. LjRoot122]|uniref:TetR/AcrR family transcriptional regulator n=1 Tax=Massilia sp. LjRoot122 TaxID=3342257 RepID=UPI003ECD6A48
MKPLKPAKPSATPQQQRSRESHERVISATCRLLVEEKGADFTLADVSRESGVSVGGIYGRFANRMALVQEVQLRTNELIAQENGANIAQARRECTSGKELMVRMVRDAAESLRRHKDIVKALVDASLSDPVVAAEGLRAYASHLGLFKEALLDYRDEIASPAPEQAIEFCFLSIYELLASHFGFGRRHSAGDGQWELLVANLQHQCVAFLTLPPAPAPQLKPTSSKTRKKEKP